MPQDHKIPRETPWPTVTRLEQRLLQPHVDLQNEEEPHGEQKAFLEKMLKTTGHPGTANQAALKVSLCLTAQPDNPTWVNDCSRYFDTQHKQGFMAPWGRDEFGDQGGHGQFHVASVCAILRTMKMDFRAMRWLRAWSILQDMTLYRGSCYMPGWRSQMPKAPQAPLTLQTIKTGKWVPGAKEWRWMTKAGYPQSIGAWYVRLLFELELFTSGLVFSTDDLPPVSHPVHFVRTTQGLINWMVGCQSAPGYIPCQPVAGAWGSQEFFYRREVGKPYDGPEWPTETSPGVPIEGEVLSHWRGDINGWKQLV